MKFIVDTDMGIDDAIALLMVLAHPKAEIKAITTVVGNIPLSQVVDNVGAVLDVAQSSPIPFYRGCARPLLQYKPVHATEVHGSDGLGEVNLPLSSRSAEEEQAALALIRLAREYPGEITLLTLGPLSNVALAIRLDPHFLKNLKRVVVMAAAVNAQGNTSPLAEFNIFVDPEAARIVFEAGRQMKPLIQVISWETALENPVSFEEWAKIIAGQTPVAQLVQKMSLYVKEFMQEYGSSYFPWADPLAAAVALEPDIVLKDEPRSLEVEVGQNLARGQTVVDYLINSRTPPNVEIIRKLALKKFHDLVRRAVHQG